MIPKVTSPLTKLVRTTEGVLVIGFNGALLLASVFGTLPGVQAVKYAAIVNAVTVGARQGLKALASFAQSTGLTPTEPIAGLPSALTEVPELGTNDPALESASKPDGPVS